MSKRPTLEEFDSMTPEEQDKEIQKLKKMVGDSEVNLSLACPSEVAKWWTDKTEQDKGGSVAIELLMSQFFRALLLSAIKDGVEVMATKVGIALKLLNQPIRARVMEDGRIGIEMISTEEQGFMTTPDDECDGNCTSCGGHTNDPKKTYH